MKNFLLIISCTIIIFSCNEKSKVTTTRLTDVGIKDTLPTALTIATDTLKIDSATLAFQKNDSILPGIAVGGISIGESSSSLIEKKGRPDSTDASMNKVYYEWLTKPTMTNDDTVFTSFKTFSVINGKTAKDTISHIKRIRITSHNYKTAMQVKVGSTLAYIKLQYPALKKPVAKAKTDSGEEWQLYDETAEGIAFEIVNDKCVAIIIHEKDKKYFNTSF